LSVVQQPLTYGQKVVLKEGAQGGKNGNFYAVSFGGDRGA